MYVYCKAYHLRDLRAFSDWQEVEETEETKEAKEAKEGNATPLADDTIVYILDDFTVVANPFQHTRCLFADVTEDWKDYCRGTLHFEPPAEVLAPQRATESAPS
jgi:hypothetical protein